MLIYAQRTSTLFRCCSPSRAGAPLTPSMWQEASRGTCSCMLELVLGCCFLCMHVTQITYTHMPFLFHWLYLGASQKTICSMLFLENYLSPLKLIAVNGLAYRVHRVTVKSIMINSGREQKKQRSDVFFEGGLFSLLTFCSPSSSSRVAPPPRCPPAAIG